MGRKIRVDISACSPFSSFLLQKMMLAMHRGSPIARQARLLLGFCQRSKSTQFLKTFTQVHIGGNTRSLQVGIVRHEKGGNSSNDAEDKYKDDKFKDDPDVRGILTDIKSHFDQSDKGVNVPAEPNNEEAVVNEDESESKAKENEEGSGGGGAKNMKQLLEKIYGARTKAAASETSVGGYTEYRDADSRVILDVDEEREAIRRAIEEGREVYFDKGRKPTPGEKYSRQLKGRGLRGVFDLDELVNILREEKLRDIVVIRVPEERQYCDFMIIATGRNTRHVSVVSSVILSVYKSKMASSDPVPRREGADNPSCGWIAMDMGNIALHLLDQERRELYDLESLWTVGAEFDDASRNMEQTESSLDALERLMAVPSFTSLEVEEEERIATGSKEGRLARAGGTPKPNRSHEAVLPFR